MTRRDDQIRWRLIVCGARGASRSALVERLHDTGRPRRAFTVSDTPNDVQGLSGLVAAASQAALALLVVVPGKGLPVEARRHAIIASVAGIHHVVLAVDFASFDRAVFEDICASFRAFAGGLAFTQITCIPISTRDGDNIVTRGARTSWYAGPPLLEYLETVAAEDERAKKPLRMAVRAVDASRGLVGTVATGNLSIDDQIAVLPSGRSTTVKVIAGSGGNLAGAQAGDAVTVTLAGDFDVKPGDMLAAARERPQVADQFAAHLIWLSDAPLLPERSYAMTINDCTLAATVTNLKHHIDVDSLAKLAAKTLGPGEIGVCNLSVAQPVVFDPFADNRATGSFVLRDRDSGETVAAGMIDFALRRATNIHHQNITISKAERTALMHHKPAVLWFTGLPGAGKSTVANLVEAALHARGVHTLLLDGDNVRHSLNRDLGFTEADRVENIRRIGEVAKLMTDAGLIVLCSFISPFRAERRMVRELLDENEFVEIFVDTPLAECIARDPKGLYKRALAGEIKNFTGVDQPYEAPENAELRLDAGRKDAERLVHEVIESLGRLKIL